MAEYLYVPVANTDLEDGQVRADITKAEAAGVTVLFSNLSLEGFGSSTGLTTGHFLDKQGLSRSKRLTTKAQRPLASLTPVDMLWVTGHGYGGDGSAIKSRYCGMKVKKATTGTRNAWFAVDVLADRLKKDGLPARFLDLRLAFCYSGLADGTRFGQAGVASLPLSAHGGDTCFAARLARELGARGYHHITVTGYIGEVNGSSTATGRALVKTHSKRILTLGAASISFNARGSTA